MNKNLPLPIDLPLTEVTIQASGTVSITQCSDENIKVKNYSFVVSLADLPTKQISRGVNIRNNEEKIKKDIKSKKIYKEVGRTAEESNLNFFTGNSGITIITTKELEVDDKNLVTIKFESNQYNGIVNGSNTEMIINAVKEKLEKIPEAFENLKNSYVSIRVMFIEKTEKCSKEIFEKIILDMAKRLNTSIIVNETLMLVKSGSLNEFKKNLSEGVLSILSDKDDKYELYSLPHTALLYHIILAIKSGEFSWQWYKNNCYYNKCSSIKTSFAYGNMSMNQKNDDLINNKLYKYIQLFEKISKVDDEEVTFTKHLADRSKFNFKTISLKERCLKIPMANVLFVIFIKNGIDELTYEKCISFLDLQEHIYKNAIREKIEEEKKTLQAILTDVHCLECIELACMQYFFNAKLISGKTYNDSTKRSPFAKFFNHKEENV